MDVKEEKEGRRKRPDFLLFFSSIHPYSSRAFLFIRDTTLHHHTTPHHTTDYGNAISRTHPRTYTYTIETVTTHTMLHHIVPHCLSSSHATSHFFTLTHIALNPNPNALHFTHTGLFRTQLADGIMGMSMADDTLPRQLAKQGQLVSERMNDSSLPSFLSFFLSFWLP